MTSIDDLRKRLYDRTLSLKLRNTARNKLKQMALQMHVPIELNGVYYYVVVRLDETGRKYYEDILSGLRLYQIYAIKDEISNIETAQVDLGLMPVKFIEYEQL